MSDSFHLLGYLCQVLILFNKHSYLVLQVTYVLTFLKGIVTATFVGYLIFATKMHYLWGPQLELISRQFPETF